MFFKFRVIDALTEMIETHYGILSEVAVGNKEDIAYKAMLNHYCQKVATDQTHTMHMKISDRIARGGWSQHTTMAGLTWGNPFAAVLTGDCRGSTIS